VDRSTLASRVEELIRQDIVTGALEPNERLPLNKVASRYEVSLTPLREAIKVLSADGLVVQTSQMGVRVAPISLQDVRDLYTVRELLEVQALRESIWNWTIKDTEA